MEGKQKRGKAGALRLRTASFLRFMGANLSLAPHETRARPQRRISRAACFSSAPAKAHWIVRNDLSWLAACPAVCRDWRLTAVPTRTFHSLRSGDLYSRYPYSAPVSLLWFRLWSFSSPLGFSALSGVAEKDAGHEPSAAGRGRNRRKSTSAYEKSPEAFLIASGLFLSCIKALNILSSTAVSEGKGVCEKTVRVFPHDLNNPAAAARFCHRQKRENAKRKRQAVPVSFF